MKNKESFTKVEKCENCFKNSFQRYMNVKGSKKMYDDFRYYLDDLGMVGSPIAEGKELFEDYLQTCVNCDYSTYVNLKKDDISF